MAEKVDMENFSASAEKYDSTIPAHINRHYLEKRICFIKELQPNGSVLDVGCGTGVLALALKQSGYIVKGVDSSAAMLVEAAKKSFTDTFKADSAKLPFNDNSFDLVLSIAAFHHIGDKASVLATIKEMTRVCKSGGKVLIWDHNPLNPYWKFFMKKLPWDAAVERLIPEREIVEGLRAAGMGEIRVQTKGFVPDFIGPGLLPVFKVLENLIESIPLANLLCAHNVFTAEKRSF